MKAYIDGKFYSGKNAKVSVSNKCFLFGYGVYVTVRIYNGKPFLLDDQLRKIVKSGRFLKIKLPSSSKIKNAALKTIKENKLLNNTIRIQISDGVKKPSLVIIPGEIKVNKEIYEKGVRLVTIKTQRIMPEVKSTNCIPAILANKIAKNRRAYQALLIDKEGFVREGGNSNVFFVKNNILFTPDKGILKGETREVVLKLAKKIMKINLTDIKKENIYKADECFLTHTKGEVVPVVKIDNKKIGGGKPGRITLKLLSMFRNVTP